MRSAVARIGGVFSLGLVAACGPAPAIFGVDEPPPRPEDGWVPPSADLPPVAAESRPDLNDMLPKPRCPSSDDRPPRDAAVGDCPFDVGVCPSGGPFTAAWVGDTAYASVGAAVGAADGAEVVVCPGIHEVALEVGNDDRAKVRGWSSTAADRMPAILSAAVPGEPPIRTTGGELVLQDLWVTDDPSWDPLTVPDYPAEWNDVPDDMLAANAIELAGGTLTLRRVRVHIHRLGAAVLLGGPDPSGPLATLDAIDTVIAVGPPWAATALRTRDWLFYRGPYGVRGPMGPVRVKARELSLVFHRGPANWLDLAGR